MGAPDGAICFSEGAVADLSQDLRPSFEQSPIHRELSTDRGFARNLTGAEPFGAWRLRNNINRCQ